MADAHAAMALALADGRALLTIENRDLGTAIVEHVAVDWPDVSVLPESGRPNGLRKRRGRLRAANLLVDGRRLDLLADGTALPGGLTRVALTFEKGRLVVSGSVSAAGRDADFKGRVRLGAGVGRRLRVSIEDIRLQGAPPLPLSAIANAVLAAFGNHMQGEKREPQPQEALELDVLRPLLDELLVAEGWRLPDSSSLRLSSAVVSVRGLELSWGEDVAHAVPQPAVTERTSLGYEAPLVALRRSVDDAPRGPERALAAQKLAAACERASDEQGAVAALQVCIENAGPGTLVGTAWRRLVELYARRGDPHAAARTLIASADDTRTGASEAERAAALVAAAEILRKRLALPSDAGMLLERAIALDPTSIEALEALEQVTTELNDFERLADVLERKLQVAARGPVEQQELLGRLVQIYSGPVSRPERAHMLRERLAMIDLETTPMVPIPPPQTRVGVPPIPDARPDTSTEQAAAHAAAGKSAEAGGDLERAEQAYWRAASIEAEPALRANYLVAHARVLLARGDVQTARGQLEAARERAPGHVGASALLADVSYRTQDWNRARDLYTLLEAAPEAADIVPREKLVHRRAALANRQGDVAEAEALYRELAILNPQHVGARKALAELARARGDQPGAVHRLEEVLRLMPSDAGGDLLDVRQRLGALHAELGEWDSARHYLELVVAQDPSRAPALELLLDAYDQLDMPAEAAKVCARLARLYFEPSRRAAALYRQAEILRARLGNSAAALDAYLRSSDLDPRFVPARLRLVDHFWNVGDLDVVAELANDLSGVPLSPDNEPDLVARLAIATTTLRAGTKSRFPFTPALAQAGVRVLVEAASYQEQEARSIETLDGMLTRARIWAGVDGEPMLYATLTDMLREDPGQPGAASALGRFAELGGRLALARAAYGLAAFVMPDCPAARHISAARLSRLRPAGGRGHRRSGRPPRHQGSGPARAGRPRRRAARIRPRRSRAETDGGQRTSSCARHRAASDRRSHRLAAVHRRPRCDRRDDGGRAAAPARHPHPARRPADRRVDPDAQRKLVVVRRRSRAGDAAQRAAHVRSRRRRGAGPAAGGRPCRAGRRPGGRTAGPRRRRLAAEAGGDAPARLRGDARGDPGRRRGGAGVAARLAGVHPRRDAHAQSHRPAGVHQPRRRPHRAEGR